MAGESYGYPGTVEEIFRDYSGRRSAFLQALSVDVEKLYSLCDPGMENLCLYGHPNGTWEVSLPAQEVPPDLPEPALGINFARDGMQRHGWLSLVAVHSDCWLLSVSSYFGFRLSRNDKKRLFSLINDLPTLFEVVTSRKTIINDRPSMSIESKSQNGIKRSTEGEARSTRKLMEESYEDEEEAHGECVKITPAKAESMKQYKCPSCSTKKGDSRVMVALCVIFRCITFIALVVLVALIIK